jgi:hypothetical protein
LATFIFIFHTHFIINLSGFRKKHLKIFYWDHTNFINFNLERIDIFLFLSLLIRDMVVFPLVQIGWGRAVTQVVERLLLQAQCPEYKTPVSPKLKTFRSTFCPLRMLYSFPCVVLYDAYYIYAHKCFKFF